MDDITFAAIQPRLRLLVSKLDGYLQRLKLSSGSRYSTLTLTFTLLDRNTFPPGNLVITVSTTHAILRTNKKRRKLKRKEIIITCPEEKLECSSFYSKTSKESGISATNAAGLLVLHYDITCAWRQICFCIFKFVQFFVHLFVIVAGKARFDGKYPVFACTRSALRQRRKL